MESPREIEISVVIPVYEGASCLEELHRRLKAHLSSFLSSYEIVFVEDGSQDDSWAKIKDIAVHDENTIGLRFKRNFGQHAAIKAGLLECRGRWAVVMDCDLEDPPEDIVRLYTAAKEGVELVFAKRQKTRRSFFRRMSSAVYFSLLKTFTGVNTELAGAFTLLSRRAIAAYLENSRRNRQYNLILQSLPLKSAVVEYERHSRFAGESAYSLTMLVKLACSGFVQRPKSVLEFEISERVAS